MTIKFGPTEVTVTALSRIHEGQLEISGLAINEICERLTYLQLAQRLFERAKISSFTEWPVPSDLPLKNIFTLFSTSTPSLRVFQTTLGLISEHNSYRDDVLNLLSTMVWVSSQWGRYILGESIERKISEFDSHCLAKSFLRFLRSSEPSLAEVAAFDLIMLMHAENELNLSTFGLRMAASAGGSLRDSVIAAAAILGGPLHGGASLEVMTMFDTLADSIHIDGWIDQLLIEKRKIMGFGHLLYKEGDPRAPLLKKVAQDLGAARWMTLALMIEEKVFRAKGLRPNIDFYSGLIYRILNIPKALAPSIFGMSRLLGWAMHYEEQNRVKTMIVPKARFIETLD